MKNNKALIGWAAVVVGVVVAAFLGVRYPMPEPPPLDEEPVAGALSYAGAVYFPPGGDQLVVGSGGEIEVQSGGELNVDGDTTLANLTVSGGVTGTNVLITGNQTIAGVKTFTTPAAFTGGLSTNLAVVTGPTAAATATPAAIVNNTGAANVSFEVRDSATPVFQVLNGGSVAANAVYAYAPVAAKTGNYTVTTADTGTVIKSSGSITMTIPGAVAGLNYCIVNYDGGDLTIDFTDATDVALNEVNAPGDRVTNTTAFDWICLTAIDTTNWMTLGSLGTWSDGN